MSLLVSSARERDWLTGLRPRPVVLTIPHPADESLRRLARATTWQGPNSWYNNPRNALSPSPRFRGEANASRIWITRFDAAAARRSHYTAWLDARLEPRAGEQAMLWGTIGPRQPARAAGLLAVSIAGLIALAFIAVGTVLLVRGHLFGLVPAVLAPPILPAFVMASLASGVRGLERDIRKLVWEVDRILDSATTFLPLDFNLDIPPDTPA